MQVFSEDKTSVAIDKEKIVDFDKKMEDAGTEVVTTKNGKGAALSMAYAGSVWSVPMSLLRGVGK